ncbi:MAG: hypothetical protein MUE92_09425 [Chloroflexi bacterium]|nr:hypothetical protein [Chloroflexota bacterium]
MDDRLQRRLRDADPLATADGPMPAGARLDAIKEQIMLTEQAPVRSALRPRPIGVIAVAAVALAAVLAVGALVRPGTTALAWAPDPTAVGDADRAAAYATCTEDIPFIGSGGVAPGDARPEVEGAPATPAEFPPLVALELHGNGGVAILADEDQVGYCLIKREADGDFVYGGLTLGAAAAGLPGALNVSAMTTEFEDVALSVVSGTAPAGTSTVRIAGGAGDGGTATVTDGRFAIWIPGPIMGGAASELVALDASGTEVARQTLSRGGEDPVVIEATPAP